MNSLAKFANTMIEYMEWHGFDTQYSPHFFTFIYSPGPSPVGPLSEFQRARSLAAPSPEGVLKTYGPWSVNIIVPDWTWDYLSEILVTMPFPDGEFKYDPDMPGHLYANQRRILYALFAGGEISEEERRLNPLELNPISIREHATDYLSSLVTQYAAVLSREVEDDTGDGDSVSDGAAEILPEGI